jgi:hypothetical protein
VTLVRDAKLPSICARAQNRYYRLRATVRPAIAAAAGMPASREWLELFDTLGRKVVDRARFEGRAQRAEGGASPLLLRSEKRSALCLQPRTMRPAMHTSINAPADTHRAAGVLLHPTSLPGSYGVGELGDHLVAFLDWAQSAGMRVWQVLPLNPPGYGASPYGCLSSFAGNPLLISPQRLLQDGLLDVADVADAPRFSDDEVEFDRVEEYKIELLQTLVGTLRSNASDELRAAFDAFVDAPSSRSGSTTTRCSWR